VICRFCGSEIDLLHALKCDGRQGAIEAALEAVPDPFRDQRARNTDPETSHEAARANRNTDRARCEAALEARGPAGFTDYELADRLGLQQNSAGKRRGELRDLGLVVDSGLRRRAPSGAWAIVWRSTTAAERLQRAG
jgi:hypothetical protein